jgi:hypothetical protein
MTVFLNKRFRKTTDQDWSGIMIDASKSISSIPDSLDSFDIDTDLLEVYRYVRPKKLSANGYSGWNREYIGDNELVISFLFDTVKNAVLYLDNRKALYANSHPFTEIRKKAKIEYEIKWEIINNSGETIEILKT